jgi:hypothetical protein
MTIKFMNSPLYACRGRSEQKPRYGLMTLSYQVYYLKILKRLHKNIRRKRTEIFAKNSWILHHDNAPAHAALSVREQITVLERPPYSPDPAHNDIFLFRKLKEILKGNILMTLMTSGIIWPQLWRPFQKNHFQNCFEGWTRRWHRCTASQGEYFEGDRSDIQQWGM